MSARSKGALDLVPSLKGKCLFAASHVFGKCSQIAIQAIRQCETGTGHSSDVSSVVRLAERALSLLRSSGPRTASLWSEQPPVVVYTDGAREASSTLASRREQFLSTCHQAPRNFSAVLCPSRWC